MEMAELKYPSLKSLCRIAAMGHAPLLELRSSELSRTIPRMVIRKFGEKMGICWLGVFLRHPQSLWSLSESSVSPKQYAVADRRQAAHGEI
jgi:hypothetical protein